MLRSILILVMLIVMATTISPAQGLGGLLNKAKAKLNQVTDRPVDTAVSAARSGLPANGEDPATPPEMTLETQQEYTRLLLSDTRPVVIGSSSYTAAYHQLSQLQHFPIRFTWDKPALLRCIDSRIWLFGYISDFCSDLVGNLNGTTYEVYLRPRLAKIKEIHFTPSNDARNLDAPGAEQGWFYSFDPATGVLTAGFNEYASSVGAWSSLTKWIIKNVSGRATDKPTDTAISATQSRSPVSPSLEDPPTPPKMTPETQEEYTRLLLADTRPVSMGSRSYTAAYRQLNQLQHFPIRFTWDKPALLRCIDSRIWLFGYISDICSDLVGNLNGTTREASLRPRLAKIKEIHFTPSNKDKARDPDAPGAGQGWFYSFDPATGVLTASFDVYATSAASSSNPTNWIIKNVK